MQDDRKATGMNELVCAHRYFKLVSCEMLDGIGPSMDVPCKSLRKKIKLLGIRNRNENK